jgi:O-acetyl-ADP-ribose deacetylase (regulator of RNase III)
MQIDLIEGDIASVKADAIVNAANNHLWMGAGVAGALKRAGGEEIEREAIKLGPIAVGDVATTGPGKLSARHVIHAAVMGQDLIPTGDSIRKATRNALRVADELGLESIAFPALGTGVGGFALDKCAAIMASEVRALRPVHLRRVIFVLYGHAAFDAFSHAMRENE